MIALLKEILGFLKTWYVWLTIVVLVLVVTGTLNAEDIGPLLHDVVDALKSMNPLGGG